jgi:hypothetical protein
MNKVKVKKEQLLEKLTVNRESHKANFIKAQKGFRQEVIEQLDKALQDARLGRNINTSFRLPAPKDQTEDYDTAIEMLNWAVGNEVELTQQEFRQYIFDDWSWSQNWLLSNTSYMNKEF